MAFRVRPRRQEDGDHVDPRDWNENNAAFADEFNGRLDRDNLPELSVDVNQTTTSPRVFTRNYSHIATTNVVLTAEDASWVDGDGTTSLANKSFTVDCDGTLEVEWSGSWEWGRSPAHRPCRRQ